MSGPNQVRRFLGALSSLVLEGELPPDETPFVEGNAEIEAAAAAAAEPPQQAFQRWAGAVDRGVEAGPGAIPGVTVGAKTLEALRGICPRCRGEGEVVSRGVIMACDEPGCVFRKG